MIQHSNKIKSRAAEEEEEPETEEEETEESKLDHESLPAKDEDVDVQVSGHSAKR